MTSSDATVQPWWGTVNLDEEQAGRWTIGPTTLWLFRTAHEWRLLYRETGDPLEGMSDIRAPLSEAAWNEAAAQADEDAAVARQRHTFRATAPSVTLSPIPADRPVVVRPEHPLSVPAGEEVRLYVSTPLWVRIETNGTRLQDVPSHRPSDTWFGPSTREGELCYASRTAGRVNLAHLPLRMHRAVTPLRVRNRADDPLPLERVHVPTQYLALYRTDDLVLWTEALTIDRTRSDEEAADVRVGSGPPNDVSGATRVQDPRQELKKGLVVNTFRAIEALFGSG
jgi:hypothetical protein